MLCTICINERLIAITWYVIIKYTISCLKVEVENRNKGLLILQLCAGKQPSYFELPELYLYKFLKSTMLSPGLSLIDKAVLSNCIVFLSKHPLDMLYLILDLMINSVVN